ncbi:MAG: helix-turn-helix domain-containing protein [Candidatus Poribacteria bacterium]
MTEEQLKELIKKGEGQTLDFKDARIHPRSLAETLAAFVAADGGVVLIGVSDEGEILGVSNFKRVRDNVIYEAASRSHCDPQVQPIELERIDTSDGKTVIAVTVPADYETLHSVGGKFFLRVGTRDEALTPRELRRLMFSRGEVSFELLPCENAGLIDLDSKLINRYISKHEEHTGNPLSIPREQFLINLGCAIKKNKEIVPTNAGVLLFHQDPQLYILHSQLLCARFKGKDVIEYIDRKEFRGPLPELVNQGTHFIKTHMKMGGRIPGIKRIDYPEYPEVAFREAIINAVIHRDWSAVGEFIRVFMFDDRIEVISPGRLLPSVTIEVMQKGEAESKLRNPVIVEVFDKLGGYIEKMGTGIRRMIDGMREYGLKPPQFKFDGGVLKVTLWGPGERFMEITEEIIPEDKLKELNDRQIKAIQYLQEKGKITNREYRELCEIGWDTAHRDLSELVQKGILKREGKGSATHYRMIIG